MGVNVTGTKTKDRLRKLERYFDPSNFADMTIRHWTYHPEFREMIRTNFELDNCDIQIIQRALKRYRKDLSKGDAE